MALKREPRRKVFLYSIFIFLSLYIAIIALSYILFKQDNDFIVNPHSFMKDEISCPSCHLGDPLKNRGRHYKIFNFKKDIYSLCTKCHAPEIHHPIDIFPGKSASNRLPLDPDGAMTCTTCHDPHAPAYGNEPLVGRSVVSKLFDLTFPLAYRKYPTYLLRMTNLGGKLCLSCHEKYDLMKNKKVSIRSQNEYATSEVCRPCHIEQYERWSHTPHAKMVTSPREENRNLLAKVGDGAPLPYSEIAYVLGNHWVQRFISQKGDKLVVRTPIWLINKEDWDLSYWREYDWIKSCAGCHVTGLDPFSGTFVEKSVGCEACHGPGRNHSASGDPRFIVNPADLERKYRYMICESCHTTGHDKTGEFRYPVGYVPGEDLSSFFFGLQPKPGQDDVSFQNDGSYGDRHNQFLYWLDTYMTAVNETCDLCKNFRFRGQKKVVGYKDKRGYCLSCHNDKRERLSHRNGKNDSGNCMVCHEADKSSRGNHSIHDHKFTPGKGLD